MKIAPLFGSLGLLALALTLSACDRSGYSQSPSTAASSPTADRGPSGTGGAQRAQPVTVTRAKVQNVPLVLSAQGNVLPLDEVDIRPQKTGTVSRIHVKEGGYVKTGQVLFSLDDREDLANLHKAEATLTGTQAQITIAQRQLDRNQDLFDKNFLSSAVLDASKNQIETLQSQLAQNRAAVEQLRAVLSYSVIRAPFDGRVGRIDVRPGSLVLANTSISMVKITRIDPIAVSFNLPERDLVRLRAAMDKGPVGVRVEVPGQKDGEVRGKVVFIDNAIDKASGTIAVKAQVDNADKQLWPGQYVVTLIDAGTTENAIVLPAQSIVNGPNNRFVYVVDADSTVRPQPVELMRITGTDAVVTGIRADAKVVLEGSANLRPGGKVVEVAPGNGTRAEGRKGAQANQSGPAANSARSGNGGAEGRHQ